MRQAVASGMMTARQALNIVSLHRDTSLAARQLLALVEILPDAFLQDCLAAARDIRDEDDRASVLGSLAERMPEAAIRSVLQVIRDRLPPAARHSIWLSLATQRSAVDISGLATDLLVDGAFVPRSQLLNGALAILDRLETDERMRFARALHEAFRAASMMRW